MTYSKGPWVEIEPVPLPQATLYQMSCWGVPVTVSIDEPQTKYLQYYIWHLCLCFLSKSLTLCFTTVWVNKNNIRRWVVLPLVHLKPILVFWGKVRHCMDVEAKPRGQKMEESICRLPREVWWLMAVYPEHIKKRREARFSWSLKAAIGISPALWEDLLCNSTRACFLILNYC